MKKQTNTNWLLFLMTASIVAVLLFDQVRVDFNVSIGAGDEIVADAQGRIPDHYIVVFKDNVTDVQGAVKGLAKAHGISPSHTYEYALKGFAAKLSSGQLKKIQDDPRVASVSQDRVVHALGTIKGKPSGGTTPPPPQSAPTGIRRIGAENLANNGAGIGVAVLDTGIDLDHPDLVPVVSGAACVQFNRQWIPDDDNGHGSHVAGTIAARDNTKGVVGVAPEATLIAVKVLNKRGSGSWSQIICGIDWVISAASTLNIKVVNMSLGGTVASNEYAKDCQTALANFGLLPFQAAVCRLRNAGITIVVAAGNESAHANTLVPAGFDDAVIAVSALTDTDGLPGGTGLDDAKWGKDDIFPNFSNYGVPPVDIGAPGVYIHSTYKNGGYANYDGTSMATPHVSGAAALYISTHPGASWTQVRDALKAMGEPVNSGHTDPSGLHPEPVLQAGGL